MYRSRISYSHKKKRASKFPAFYRFPHLIFTKKLAAILYFGFVMNRLTSPKNILHGYSTHITEPKLLENFEYFEKDFLKNMSFGQKIVENIF